MRHGRYLADQGTHGGDFVGSKSRRNGRPPRRHRQDQADQTEFTRRPAPSLHSGLVGRPRRPARAPQQDRRRRHFALAARPAVIGL